METRLKQQNDRAGFLAGIFATLLVICCIAAGLKISQEPRSTVNGISRDDLELFDHANGDGTYTTLTITNALGRFGSIDWLGPTNAISMTNQEYYFSASTSCSITGIVNKAVMTNSAPPVVLTIDNTSGANITCYWVAPIITADATSDFLVISNGNEGVISLRYNGRAAKTNIVARQFGN